MPRSVFLDNTPGRGTPLEVSSEYAKIVADSWLAESYTGSVFNIVFKTYGSAESFIVHITYTKYLDLENSVHLYVEITISKIHGELVSNFTTERLLANIVSNIESENIFSISKDIYSSTSINEVYSFISRMRRI